MAEYDDIEYPQDTRGPVTKWVGDTLEGSSTGALIWGAGTALEHVPKLGWLGRLGKSLGKFQTSWAPIQSTINTVNDATGFNAEYVPQTAAGHTKKWLRNAGTQAGIGAAMMGAGKLVSMIPHPAGKVGGKAVELLGRGLTAGGKLAVGWAPLDASITTGIDMLTNSAAKNAPQLTEEQQAVYEDLVRRQQRTNAMYAGGAALAGLAGANLLLGATPLFKRRRWLQYMASLAAAGGAGYLGWKYSQNHPKYIG